MGKKFDFEYIVIGSGPAGSAVALGLAARRKKVAIIEGRKFGGANLNTMDVPYAVGLDLSHLYRRINEGKKFGISSAGHFNFPTAMNWRERVIEKVGGGNKEVFEKAGIVCIEGFANLVSDYVVMVGDKQFSAERFVLATGARLDARGISGLDTVAHLEPETVMTAKRLPKAVVVVGGGATGCEVAEYFAELGVKVLIMERSERLLPREDKEVGEILTEHFKTLGINVLVSSKVVALEKDEISKRVVFMTEGREKMVRVDEVVIATGYSPVLDYGLENTSATFKKSGITVDKNLQTTARNIFAVGDILGGESSTELASYQGAFLANNLAGKVKMALNYNGFSRRVATYPEIATVGLSEDDLLKRDRRYKKAIVYLSEIPASKIYDFDKGFVKLIADFDNHLIGATVVAPKAEEMIGELALAVRNHLLLSGIASMPHPANSFSEAIEITAKKLVKEK